MATAPGDVGTVTTLIGDNPCVQCFEGMELDALLVLLLASLNNYTLPDDVDTLMALVACESCATDTQLKQAIASKLWTFYENGQTSAQLKEKLKCLLCTDAKKLKDLATYLIIKHIQSLQAPT